MAASLVISVEGEERDGGAVSLADLNKFTADVQDCLKRVSARVVGVSGVRHLVTDLAVGSATLGLRAAPPARYPDAGGQVYTEFGRVVHSLEHGGEVDRRLRPDDLRAFRKLATPVLSRRRVRIGEVDLTTQFVANIDKRLAALRQSLGTVKGRVEKLNVHGRHEFTLFTAIGSEPVLCTFPDELFDQVKQAVKRNVTVTGLCAYSGNQPYPDRVQVRRLDVHPPDGELPTLASLQGLFRTRDAVPTGRPAAAETTPDGS